MTDIAVSYGREDTPWLAYTWVNKFHNFEVPMYYISYGTSAVAALQIYQLAETNRDAAMEAWCSILHAGGVSSYMETVENAGLNSFSDTDYTIDLFSSCADEVAKICSEL